jgi:hypothetical protein
VVKKQGRIMPALPSTDLRSNIATWAVPTCHVPAVAGAMLDTLPRESFDPAFHGQDITTTYFDTTKFDLCKARRRGDRYLTLRVRCYQNYEYALSAKTEDQKYRLPLDSSQVGQLLGSADLRASDFATLLPGDLLARLDALIGSATLHPVIAIHSRRYAVEDAVDRLTLDLDIATDTGKCLPTGVLEFKSQLPGTEPPVNLTTLNLRPIKLSKFLWSTQWR